VWYLFRMLGSALNRSSRQRATEFFTFACLCLASSSLAQSQSASLHLVAQRPALLWLDVNGISADNVSDPSDNNGPVSIEFRGAGDLEVRVRANFAYWLSVTTETRRHEIYGTNPMLDWDSYDFRFPPSGGEAEWVRVTLNWEPDEHPTGPGRARAAQPSGPEVTAANAGTGNQEAGPNSTDTNNAPTNSTGASNARSSSTAASDDRGRRTPTATSAERKPEPARGQASPRR
jgi:predicted dehydrogenase